jgi:alpha-L-fucosidase 2
VSMTPDSMEWSFPLPRTHTGIALGNGNFGALAWGEDRLCITVNRSDFWDHRNGETVPEWASYDRVKAAVGQPGEQDTVMWIFNDPENPPPEWKSSRLPFGRFEFVFADGIVPKRALLSPETGLLRVELSDGAALELAMAMDSHVLAVRDAAKAVVDVHVRTAWEWTADGLRRRGLAEPEHIREAGTDGWVQVLPEDPAMAALCRRTAEGCLLCVERGDDGPAALAVASEALAQGTSLGMSSLFGDTQRWWQAYWRDVPEVELPDEDLSRLLRYFVYRFGAATAPGGHAAGLQGPWAEEYQMMPWNGDYHFNVNVQEVYTLAVHAGHPAHLLPLFDMLEAEPFYNIMRQTAKRVYGVDDGLVITHAVDDRGRQVGGLSGASVLDQACGGWTAQLYWLYYQYTGDVTFLRDRAYPFLRGMMRAYEGMLAKRDGRYHIPASISAEYRGHNAHGEEVRHGPDPSYQIACIHMLLGALFEACGVLEIEPEATWRDIQANLPLYTLVGEPEKPRIGVWEGQDLTECHRHHSHLACIYPFDTLDATTPEMQAVVDNSINHWISMGMGEWSEWCFPWAAILQARVGLNEGPKTLLSMWRDVFINEGLTTVYLPRSRGITNHRQEKTLVPLETNEVMQLDGTSGGATAMYEMLAHVRRGVIRIFPGVPSAWRDVAFSRMPLPGMARLSARKQNGRFLEAELVSLRGGTYRVEIAGLNEAQLTLRDRTEEISLPVCIELGRGEMARIRPTASA